MYYNELKVRGSSRLKYITSFNNADIYSIAELDELVLAVFRDTYYVRGFRDNLLYFYGEKRKPVRFGKNDPDGEIGILDGGMNWCNDYGDEEWILYPKEQLHLIETSQDNIDGYLQGLE